MRPRQIISCSESRHSNSKESSNRVPKQRKAIGRYILSLPYPTITLTCPIVAVVASRL
ncbi:hypothetical protein GYMLUDRAFT_34746 [Collybiopsis luxurians FD-317 M1]|nr:hypothetical protein GYMLUDRAFT_34746 [Collybiopsis luxurians FD-317 M1]